MSKENKVVREIRLRTDGIDIVFYFRPEKYPEQALLRIVIENRDGEQKIRSIEDIVERKDMIRLCGYLVNHIEKIKEKPDVSSHRFADYTMLYEIQASGGVWNHEENYGVFSLLFLVNVGRSSTNKRIWMGSETRVDSREIIYFCNRIANALQKLL